MLQNPIDLSNSSRSRSRSHPLPHVNSSIIVFLYKCISFSPFCHTKNAFCLFCAVELNTCSNQNSTRSKRMLSADICSDYWLPWYRIQRHLERHSVFFYPISFVMLCDINLFWHIEYAPNLHFTNKIINQLKHIKFISSNKHTQTHTHSHIHIHT